MKIITNKLYRKLSLYVKHYLERNFYGKGSIYSKTYRHVRKLFKLLRIPKMKEKVGKVTETLNEKFKNNLKRMLNDKFNTDEQEVIKELLQSQERFNYGLLYDLKNHPKEFLKIILILLSKESTKDFQKIFGLTQSEITSDGKYKFNETKKIRNKLKVGYFLAQTLLLIIPIVILEYGVEPTEEGEGDGTDGAKGDDEVKKRDGTDGAKGDDEVKKRDGTDGAKVEYNKLLENNNINKEQKRFAIKIYNDKKIIGDKKKVLNAINTAAVSGSFSNRRIKEILIENRLRNNTIKIGIY